ncbi:unnamed protein product [Clavelina lepadiformis]|uniref:Glycosyltransferase 2-like domain-containing protein n=1 Tax=Clavelina lepadiformis TaxID=159417 RepID=A0ABP0FPC8_CLALP
MSCRPLVSIILPVYNGEAWLDSCLQSISEQTHNGPMELCVFNDASTDRSMEKIEEHKQALNDVNIAVIITTHENESTGPKGCGYAKNKAVQSSSGNYLCFLDADDVMHPDRIRMQFEVAESLPKNTLLGCQVVREPVDSTVRYSKWINKLSQDQLYSQIYTSNGPTVVMPTWFCHRFLFDTVGEFDEGGKGVPEDYLFFLKLLSKNGKLHRVDRALLTYRHHPTATTMSISEETIWKIRLQNLQENVLSKWSGFTIWNAGKQGRKFYRDLREETKEKVICFCDVDPKKISKRYYIHELSHKVPKPKVPILHFSEAPKPFIICVKLDLTGGAFEENLSSLNLKEGVDYFHFN